MPTWKFLCVFFLLFELFHVINPIFPKLTMQDYTRSFLFISGIGYVWIISVYLMTALMAPILEYFLQSWGNKKFVYVLTILYIIYDIMMRAALYFTIGKNNNLHKLLMIIYIGYIYIYGIGMIIRILSKKQIYILLSTQTLVFMLYAIINQFESVSIEKYPPTAYYLSYGLAISVILYLILENGGRLTLQLKENIAIEWFSQNSLWIYLWHIIPVKIFVDYNIIFINSWILRYIIIISIAILITVIQEQIYKRLYC